MSAPFLTRNRTNKAKRNETKRKKKGKGRGIDKCRQVHTRTGFKRPPNLPLFIQAPVILHLAVDLLTEELADRIPYVPFIACSEDHHICGEMGVVCEEEARGCEAYGVAVGFDFDLIDDTVHSVRGLRDEGFRGRGGGQTNPLAILAQFPTSM